MGNLFRKHSIKFLSGLSLILCLGLTGCASTGQQANSDEYSIRDARPQWSPNGDKIVFGSLRTGNDDVWIVDLATGDLANLTSNSSFVDFDPTWSPDGNHIAFVSNRAGNEDIWLMTSSGSDVVNLTLSSVAEDFSPEWSPDGRYIAFVSNRSGKHDIWLVNADGSNPENLTQFATDTTFVLPSWSKDGNHIAFFDVAGSIWIADFLNGKYVARKIVTDKYLTHLALSPDGASVATHSKETGKWHILLAGVADKRLVDLFEPADSVSFPSWSPDSTRITYMDFDSNIWYINVNTREKTNLTQNRVKGAFPVWSSNQQYIAFESRQGPSSIWMVDVNSLALTNLTGS